MTDIDLWAFSIYGKKGY